MTIDEAIKHCKEVAEKNENEAEFGFGNAFIDRSSCLECAKEHRQLATWLEELKILKEQTSGDCISRKATLKAFFDYVGRGTGMNDYDELCIIVSNMPPVTPQPNKWIPISKEVPKEKGEYITTTMYGEVFCDYWDGDRFDRTEAVLAWQKLPAPFKPQERDDESCDAIWERAYKERDGEPQPEEHTETHECDKKECWIEHRGTFKPHIECPKCGCWFLREDLPRNSYCPNCGSRNHWEWELKLDGGKKE